jgi:hypothetical protein
MDHAGDFDAIAGGSLEDQVVARAEGTGAARQVVAQLAHERLRCQQGKSFQQLLKLTNRRRWIPIRNEVRHLIEIALGKAG